MSLQRCYDMKINGANLSITAGFSSILMDDRYDIVYGDRFKLVPREDALQSGDPASASKYPAGFKKQGFLSFVMTNEQYGKLAETKPKLIIAGGAAEREDMREGFMEEAVFDFIYNEDSKEERYIRSRFLQRRFDESKYCQ